MASICSRVINRTSSLRYLKSAIDKPKLRPGPPFRGSTTTSSVPRISSFVKSPVEQLACVQSLLPFHSAVAVARLNSCLSASSSCRALSQGTLCCTSPGL